MNAVYSFNFLFSSSDIPKTWFNAVLHRTLRNIWKCALYFQWSWIAFTKNPLAQVNRTELRLHSIIALIFVLTHYIPFTSVYGQHSWDLFLKCEHFWHWQWVESFESVDQNNLNLLTKIIHLLILSVAFCVLCESLDHSLNRSRPKYNILLKFASNN